MKYIVIELQTNTDGTVGNLVYAYDSRDDADSKFHAILAAAAVSNVPRHAAVLMNSDGNVYRSECYTHTVTAQPDSVYAPDPAGDTGEAGAPVVEPEAEPFE